MNDYARSVDELLRRVPEFQPTYDQAMADFGELLPTLLFADFGRFVEIEARRPCPDDDLLARSFDALEYLWDTYDRGDMANALGTGFLEHFSPDSLALIRPRLGPGLMSMVETQEAWFAKRRAERLGQKPPD